MVKITLTGEGWGCHPYTAFTVQNAAEILQTNRVDRIVSVIKEIEKKTQEGCYAIGFIGYEAAAAFGLPVLRTQHNTQHNQIPLLWFALVHPDDIKSIPFPQVESKKQKAVIQLHEDFKDFQNTIQALKEQIQSGNTYQVNYTIRASVSVIDWTEEQFFLLYQSQPVPYAAYIETHDWKVISFSPELFLKRNNTLIQSVPMKGTHQRGRFLKEDLLFCERLQHSEKDRAENIMIVDMVRHDLGKIAELSSVCVVDPFHIEHYQTVLQMTSTVNAALKENTHLHHIFEAAFPAASITGAPKHRTMQIICENEKSERGVYCGTIGLIKPNGDFTFNVAIRTIVERDQQTILGVGSGIVWDSVVESEYEEIHTKTRFLSQNHQPFALIETLLYEENRTLLYLDEHLDRLESSAHYFKYPFDRIKIMNEIILFVNDLNRPCAVRLLLDSHGTVSFSSRDISTIPDNPKIKLSTQTIDSSDPFYFHKTTNREVYNNERQLAVDEGFFEAVFLNETGYITEGCITNIFICKDNRWVTPPVTDGLLSGVWRAYFIRDVHAIENHITKEDVYSAENIVIGNSVIGAIKVTIT